MEQESNTTDVIEQYENKPDNESKVEGEEQKYSSVVVKPTKSNKMSALSRIKAIQENDWKTWKGPSVKHAGRPGTAGIIKSRTKKDPNPLEAWDDQRLKNILKVILKMQSIDEDGIVYLNGNLAISMIFPSIKAIKYKKFLSK